MSTPTPRTSSAIIASGFQAVPEGFRAFAGNLERELTALTAERDQLRAENATLRPQMSTPMPRTCGEISCDECNDRYAALAAECDQLRDELAKERARLDSGQILLTVSGERVWHSGVDLRAAIDAAMQEAAK